MASCIYEDETRCFGLAWSIYQVTHIRVSEKVLDSSIESFIRRNFLVYLILVGNRVKTKMLNRKPGED